MFPWLLAVTHGQTGAAPTGPPGSVRTQYYAGTKVKVTWTPGDTAADSLVYLTNSEPVENNPTRLAAGVASFETGLGIDTLTCVEVSHLKNGQETALIPSDSGPVQCA